MAEFALLPPQLSGRMDVEDGGRRCLGAGMIDRPLRFLLFVGVALLAPFGSALAAEAARPVAKAAVVNGAIHIDDDLDYNVPAGSGLRFVKLDADESVATFAGRITLSGRYYYGRLDDYGDDRIGLYFHPDAGAAKRLPHMRQQGPAKEIMFQNADAFIKAAIPARVAAAVKSGKRKSAQGRVTIIAEGFQIAMLCGTAVYAMKFDSLARGPKLYAARNAVTHATC